MMPRWLTFSLARVAQNFVSIWLTFSLTFTLHLVQLFLYIENPWLDQGFDKALAMSL